MNLQTIVWKIISGFTLLFSLQALPAHAQTSDTPRMACAARPLHAGSMPAQDLALRFRQTAFKENQLTKSKGKIPNSQALKPNPGQRRPAAFVIDRV